MPEESKEKSRLCKYYKKNQMTKSGGQGIKKLQLKFWQIKYPNLFSESTKAAKVAKADKPKGKRKADLIQDD